MGNTAVGIWTPIQEAVKSGVPEFPQPPQYD